MSNHSLTQIARCVYLVLYGRKPGIYTRWFNGAYEQVDRFPGAILKRFKTYKATINWIRNQPPELFQNYTSNLSAYIADLLESMYEDLTDEIDMLKEDYSDNRTIIYTDGGANPNPGPGGYGVVIKRRGGARIELSGGFARTTSQRMELMACIVGLRQLKSGSKVVIYTDSKYVIETLTNGEIEEKLERARQGKKKNALQHVDLWQEMLALYSERDVKFRWIPGHRGFSDNERCDWLAREAARQPDLPVDAGFKDL